MDLHYFPLQPSPYCLQMYTKLWNFCSLLGTSKSTLYNHRIVLEDQPDLEKPYDYLENFCMTQPWRRWTILPEGAINFQIEFIQIVLSSTGILDGKIFLLVSHYLIKYSTGLPRNYNWTKVVPFVKPIIFDFYLLNPWRKNLNLLTSHNSWEQVHQVTQRYFYHFVEGVKI